MIQPDCHSLGLPCGHTCCHRLAYLIHFLSKVTCKRLPFLSHPAHAGLERVRLGPRLAQPRVRLVQPRSRHQLGLHLPPQPVDLRRTIEQSSEHFIHHTGRQRRCHILGEDGASIVESWQLQLQTRLSRYIGFKFHPNGGDSLVCSEEIGCRLAWDC